MFIEENHVKSFKDWVFDRECECTPKKVHSSTAKYCIVVVVVNDEMDADTTCLYVHISNTDSLLMYSIRLT